MEIEDSVIAKIQKRRETGRLKYGTTMERGDLTRLDWLRHAQDEALDCAVYLEKLIQSEEMLVHTAKMTRTVAKMSGPVYG